MPIFETRFDEAEDKDRAAADALSAAEAELRGVLDDVPDDVRPFVVHFLDQLTATLESTVVDGRLNGEELARDAYDFDFEKYPGIEAFATAAEASDDCVGFQNPHD